MDTIRISPEIGLKPYYIPPREPASDPQYIKHISCDGARFHVIYWDTGNKRCTEKDCIMNKPTDFDKMKAIQESLGEDIYGETYHDFE